MNVAIIGKKYDPEHPVPVDGGRLKVCLYEKKLIDEGHSVQIIDLFHWYFHLFGLLKKIRKALVTCDVIVIMGGPKGCRPLIRICNSLNKKRHKRLVFVPLGIGTLDKLLKKKSPQQINAFLNGTDYLGIKDKGMKSQLAKLNAIVPQNEILVNAYRNFYGLANVCLVRNFRDVTQNFGSARPMSNDQKIHLVFISRITEKKGVFDLLKAVASANAKSNGSFHLDIYGELQLTPTEKQVFDDSLSDSIMYKGTVQNDQIINLCRQYDFMVFPTRYHGEGTPAVIIESLIAGTPVLVSSYSQAKLLIKDGQDGFIFSIGDSVALADKLMAILQEKSLIPTLQKNAMEAGKVYLYSSNRSSFLSSLLGIEVRS